MWLICLATALATEPLTWDSVNTEALEAWSEGPGAAALTEAEGARRAARAVPLGPTSIRAEAQLGEPLQRQVLTAVELPLGLGLRERGHWTALAEARSAGADAARWTWVQEVQEAWLGWWIASEITVHLEHYAADVDGDLQQFEAAVEEGLLAPIALEDLRAESLQIRAEAAAMSERSRVAAARVHTLLGARELDAGGHDLHEADPGATNPWTGLADKVAEHPAVREATARADSERARARALGSARTPVLEAGPMWAPTNGTALRPLAFVGLSLPLQPGVGAEQREARAAESAARSEARWREVSLAAHLEEEALAWEAARTRVQRLQTEVLGPLTRRQERLEAALAEGLVTADRVIRARRERHEAEHEQVLVAGELLASEARADAVRALLEAR